MRRPIAVGLLTSVIVVCSVLAAVSARAMDALVSDRLRLQHGQWWRAFTPVLVQPSGLLALVFLAVGLVVVMPPVVARYEIAVVLSAMSSAAVGALALTTWLHPGQSTGGSSALVACAVGLWLAPILVGHGQAATAPPARITAHPGWRRRWWPTVATAYAVFFTVYLALLPTTASHWAAPTADLAVALSVVVSTRRPDQLRWVALLAGVVALAMAARLDDHGIGIVVGITVGTVARYRTSVGNQVGPGWRTVLGVVLGVVAVALAWAFWTVLYGVDLTVNTGPAHRTVGLAQSAVVAALVLTAAALGSRLRHRHTRLRRVRPTPILLVLTSISCLGPIFLATEATAAAALITLHIAVGLGAAFLLTTTNADTPADTPPSPRRTCEVSS